VTDLTLIRNFSIIAHIDHGKSTLADRFIQVCGGLSEREMSSQVLDSMDIERERGITIKAQSVSLNYTATDGKTYLLNFIDTPGHVDFSYEVSRSLAACEGALLVVDAGQGVEAQTVAVCYTAIEQSLEVLPILNKIDLPQADPDAVCAEIEDIIGIDATGAIHVSAKTGLGIQDALEALVKHIPAPQGDVNAPLQALIIDSWFDPYLGVVSLVRIVNGTLNKGQKMRVMSTGRSHEVDQVGIFTPKRTPTGTLHAGEVGYVVAGIKEILGAPVGDTLTLEKNPASAPLPGFQRVKPQVYAGLFPIQAEDFEAFRDALAKLSLNDASLFYEPESSDALGFGFRCGFLGLLHLEVFQERLRREFNLELVITVPAVAYRVTFTNGEVEVLNNPQDFGDMTRIKKIEEPILRADIIVPQTYLGNIMQLLQDRRAEYINTEYLDAKRVILHYSLPLSAILTDFYGQLKSQSSGYASLNYIFDKYQEVRVVKLDILIAEEKVDSLSMMIYEDDAYNIGRRTVAKLKDILPRQQWVVKIQAAIGGKIIAAEKLSALRKDVTAKLYGGDVTRKRKLLDKQKKGKKKMAGLGKIKIPSEAYLAILKKDD